MSERVVALEQAVLPGEWRTTTAIAREAGASSAQAHRVLSRMLRRGEAEKRMREISSPGRGIRTEAEWRRSP